MSPLERAILDIPKTGWALVGLSRSPFDCVEPWSCDLVPTHFGSYYFGRKVKAGQYTVYENAMARIVASGKTPLETIQRALALLDKHPAKAVYKRLERAFEEAANERT